MAEKTVVIRNRAGIHCRPSSSIIAFARNYPKNQFNIKTARGDADLTSIIGLLTLGIQCGEQVLVQASGPDDLAACEALAQQLEYEFDFPPQ